MTAQRTRVVELPAGSIDVTETGEGVPVMLLHGALVDETIWSDVVPALAARGYRCITPTLPLGAHRRAMHDGADLSLPALGTLVAALIRRVGPDPVTIVSNDTATAIALSVLADHPGSVSAAVLTSGDAFDYFFPPMFRPLQWLARVPGGIRVIAAGVRIRSVRNSWLAFRWLTRTGIDDARGRRWSQPILADRNVRRDAVRFLRLVDNRYTLQLADRLGRVSVPVQLVWAEGDRVFPVRLADRLGQLLPRATVMTLPDTRAFIPIDAPGELADIIDRFLAGLPDE